MNTTTQAPAAALDVANVAQVYSGAALMCCCGCKGKHTYASRVAADGVALRGYAIDPADVNDRVVRRHVATINRVLAGAVPGGAVDVVTATHVAVTVGARWYIAYFG